MAAWICLYFVAALAQEPGPVECTSIGNSAQCVSDDDGVVLLQTNLRVTTLGSVEDKGARSSELNWLASDKDANEANLETQGEAHALVNARTHANSSTTWFERRRRRRRRRWSITSTISDIADTATDAGNAVADTATDWGNTVADTATDWANKVADWTNEATSAAETLLDKLVDEFETAAIAAFEAIVPECLRSGDILSCLDSNTEEWLSTTMTAISDGYTLLTSCITSIGGDIADLANIVTDIQCTQSVDISYPSGIDFSWPPELEWSTGSMCTNIGGINTDVMTSMFPSFEQCGEDMFTFIASAIDDSSLFTPGCSCPDNADFGIYLGAALEISISAATMPGGLAGSLSAGFVVGCDGCNFRFSPFWSWYAGVTSASTGASVSALIGYATTWDNFWGQCLVVGASADVYAYSFGVGVGFSLPIVTISTDTQTVSTGDICIMDMCVSLSVDIDFVPTGIDIEWPEFITIDVGMELVSTPGPPVPVDVGAGFAEAFEIDLVLDISTDRRRRRVYSVDALTDNMQEASLSGCWVAENGYITENDTCDAIACAGDAEYVTRVNEGSCECKQYTDNKISWQMYCDSASTSATLKALVYATNGWTDSVRVQTGSEESVWHTGQGSDWFWSETTIAVQQGAQTLSFGKREYIKIKDIMLPSQCSFE
jgi:hypothetical protein